jgi:hypothetical protein
MAARASDDLLAQRLDDLRDEMRAGFSELRVDMRAGFDDTRATFVDIRAEIRTLHARVDTLFLALVVGLLGIVATLAIKL